MKSSALPDSWAGADLSASTSSFFSSVGLESSESSFSSTFSASDSESDFFEAFFSDSESEPDSEDSFFAFLVPEVFLTGFFSSLEESESESSCLEALEDFL